VRIPTLLNLEQQDVKTERLGITASYQWQMGDRTRLTLDGAYSRFRNESTYNQIQTVGLNRNNTNATFNTAAPGLTPIAARALYPGLCVPNAGSDILPPQDCGQQLYGTTPAFANALSSANALTSSVLGLAATSVGGVTPATANIFSVNPFNLDPYDYYNNPASVGYIPNTNRLAFRGALIGRPGVKVLDANVTNGLADYLVLQGIDFRSAQDQSNYTTKFKQGTVNLDHEFSDTFKAQAIAGYSESNNDTVGKLAEFNRIDSQGLFVYDERAHGNAPVVNLGFDAANPANWDTVKGFSALRYFRRLVSNTYKQVKVDFDWEVNDQFNLGFGANLRKFTFSTEAYDRNNDLLNPTLKEAGATTASVAKTIQFGQGLSLPAGGTTSFVVPQISAYEKLFGSDCNCVNKWGDWRITNKRAGGQNNYRVNEKDTGFYFQADFKMDVFGRPLRGNAGTRVAITDVNSFGNTSVGRLIQGTNHYTDFLPSLNLNYEPMDNLYLRFGISKVMARPLLGNLNPAVTAISVPNTGATTGATLTVGNPKLSPFRAMNIDLSAEWYFAPGGLISVAFFNKSISSFPQTVFYESKLSELVGTDNIAAVAAQFTDANQLAYIAADGPFQARQFRDAPGGYLRGIEASVQSDFTFLPGFLSNFGVQLNYTKIWSELSYILDPGTATVPQTLGKAPFLGVSPQAFNATLYYEDSKFRARVSAAQRKGYSTIYPIASGACSPGLIPPLPANPSIAGTACNAPLINDFAYSRSTLNVDASMSYKITKFASISVEGLNLTNQTSDRYAYQGQEAVTQYGSTGRIYRVGVKVKF
jgi:iron complex outermembrane recepter protein